MAESSCSIRRIVCSNEVLGEGEFSTVFKGRFDRTDVAVKRIQLENVDPRAEEFLENHPHHLILKLIHFEQVDHFMQVFVRVSNFCH